MARDPLFEALKAKKDLFRGQYLHLVRLHVELPNHTEAIREVVQVRDAVAVLPLDADGNVHLVYQHRPAIGKTILEVPAGLLNANESLEECARRECKEETGLYPQTLTRLVTYAHAEGYSTGFITLFLGTNFKKRESTNLDPTEFVEQVALPFCELLEKVRRNEIVDSKTMLCALLSKDKMEIQ
jgi:ADP-ribose pyrophosphatase